MARARAQTAWIRKGPLGIGPHYNIFGGFFCLAHLGIVGVANLAQKVLHVIHGFWMHCNHTYTIFEQSMELEMQIKVQ
jgi:hypothetical protein